MARYGLATIFEPHPVGHEFTVDSLPLHISIIDSFEVNLEADELAAKLRAALKNQKPFSVMALADEMYGPEKDIPVTTLELSAELVSLHRIIIALLMQEGAVLKNPQFNGDNFTPHISIYGSKRVNPGEQVLINDISIAAKVSEAEDANRQVLANISFHH
jgi:hypothetical protein